MDLAVRMSRGREVVHRVASVGDKSLAEGEKKNLSEYGGSIWTEIGSFALF